MMMAYVLWALTGGLPNPSVANSSKEYKGAMLELYEKTGLEGSTLVAELSRIWCDDVPDVDKVYWAKYADYERRVLSDRRIPMTGSLYEKPT